LGQFRANAGRDRLTISRLMNKAVSNKHSSLLFLVLLIYGCATSVKAPVVSTAKDQLRQDKTIYQPGQTPLAEVRQKGFHVVVKGDTLYSIAWKYAHDYKNVARWNGVSAPYVIFPGQLIRLKPPPQAQTRSLQPGPLLSKKNKTDDAKTKKPPEKVAAIPETKKFNLRDKLVWQWPTLGKIVKLDSPIAKKGMNIEGKAGQPIKAAESGEVVYSGSGLLGYGKLIIIKHNEVFLSAYAHNNDILVKEGESVSTGQKIATMGLGNNGRPVLHFEIRKDGKPVNPLNHLPKKRT